MQMINESNLQFSFPKEDCLVKFDDTPFYREDFNSFVGSKGVDFIYLQRKDGRLYLVEVKNCKGHENENRWRILPDDKKLKSASIKPDSDSKHSLDIEIAQKIAMTMACLAGADTFKLDKKAKDYIKFQQYLHKNEKPMVCVVLVLEGDFSSYSRTKKMIMSELQRSIERKLRWLNCKVIVEDIETHNDRDYSIKEISC
jgi:hypothetical protein